MKGKVSFRYLLPTVSRIRSYVSDTKDLASFSSEIRDELPKILCTVLNRHSDEIKTEFNKFLEKKDLSFKSANHKTRVFNFFSPIFNSFFAATPEEINSHEDGVENSSDENEAPAEGNENEVENEAEENTAKKELANDEFED